MFLGVKKEFSMKRLALRILLMILTFAVGLASHWAATKFRSRNLQSPIQVAVEPPKNVVTRFEPVFYPVSVPPKPMAVFEYDHTKFFPEGSYSLIGATPREFREFKGFGIWRENINDSSGTVEVFTQYGQAWTNEVAAIAWVTEKRLFFVSQPWGNSPRIVYRFEGEFLQENPASANENTPVLRGKLTKMQNGRTVAERVVTFRMDMDGC
jgi:hypothetical protein